MLGRGPPASRLLSLSAKPPSEKALPETQHASDCSSLRRHRYQYRIHLIEALAAQQSIHDGTHRNDRSIYPRRIKMLA